MVLFKQRSTRSKRCGVQPQRTRRRRSTDGLSFRSAASSKFSLSLLLLSFEPPRTDDALCSSFPFRFVSPIASRSSLTLWQPSLHAVCRESEYQDVTTRVASPCQRIPGSTWNNSTCCRRRKGKARNISVLSAGVQSGRRAEQTRREEFAANIDRTTTRPSSLSRRRHTTLEKRRKRSRPRTNSWSCHSIQDNQPNWANTWHSQRGLFGLTCHSRLTVKRIPGTQERTRS